MSAAPRYPKDMGYAGLKMTEEDFCALCETQERYELIDGVVVMSPSPTFRHQQLIIEVLRQLLTWDIKHPGSKVSHETDLRVGRGKVFQPDLCVYAPGRLSPQ